ncbi:TRAP transporter small permease subunit [Actibacterium sp. 188UL27-1]|uniref:TRAP transporter small permease subunit n=1 Tax=Actibacterium sp. 188UL27-1 TaxID=2786961 RepID=UPI0019586D61|nr:TRAP transporter small permease subunit [Actibacterium sp. 188UL27-1]MBM7067456.1 TRAP transporter small permease subunit [Actibacterium sp. 188UL27-1]
MTRAMGTYIRTIDAVNYGLGRAVMYGLFAMMAVLLWSSISKTFLLPSLWTLETAQFAMMAYFILGGPYAIQLGANVRMDLFYGNWSDRRKAWVDCVTVLFLIFYLGVLLYGALGSTAYSLGNFTAPPLEFFAGFLTGESEVGRLERSPTAWRPYLWPIKSVIVLGLTLMLLQAISELFKDILRLTEAPA